MAGCSAQEAISRCRKDVTDVDLEERILREREIASQQKSTRSSTRIAIASFLVSAAAVAASVFFSSRTLNESASEFRYNVTQSTKQFQQSSREAHYSVIVSGLSSSAAAVQNNSMWLLREFVEDSSNYANDKVAQQAGARDAIQTLSAFIEDNSVVRGKTGLSYYESPQPIILSRAMNHLKAIDSNTTLGSHDADVSLGNFHGLSLPGFVPNGSFLAEATDFRRANLHGLDLRAQPADFSDAFLTCANLEDSRFGKAELFGADLTGANLAGADLSQVKDLTSEQLHGVTISTKTRLPSTVTVDGRQPWGAGSLKCAHLVDRMTGMHGGQGYTSSHPCPSDTAAAESLHTDPPFDGRVQDLVTACTMRNQ